MVSFLARGGGSGVVVALFVLSVREQEEGEEEILQKHRPLLRVTEGHGRRERRVGAKFIYYIFSTRIARRPTAVIA